MNYRFSYILNFLPAREVFEVIWSQSLTPRLKLRALPVRKCMVTLRLNGILTLLSGTNLCHLVDERDRRLNRRFFCRK